jgi:hypothetical protein
MSVLKSVLYVNPHPATPPPPPAWWVGVNLEGRVDDLPPPGLGEIAVTRPGVEGKKGVAEKKLRREALPS